MNVKFLNPFIEAAYEVIQAETGADLSRGGLNLVNADYVTEDVTVILSMVGDVEGNVFYSMEEGTAISLASLMLAEQLNDFNSLAQSGVAELGNVITGRASIKLSQSGFEANISPPTLLTGKGGKISTLDFQRLIVPLQGSFGRIEIHLALRQAAKSGLSAADIAIPSSPVVS